MTIGMFGKHADLIEAAVATARASGCDCDPDVTLDHEPDGTGGRGRVAHDDWCRLLAHVEGRD